jgi:hypothetical protein
MADAQRLEAHLVLTMCRQVRFILFMCALEHAPVCKAQNQTMVAAPNAGIGKLAFSIDVLTSCPCVPRTVS